MVTCATANNNINWNAGFACYQTIPSVQRSDDAEYPDEDVDYTLIERIKFVVIKIYESIVNFFTLVTQKLFELIYQCNRDSASPCTSTLNYNTPVPKLGQSVNVQNVYVTEDSVETTEIKKELIMTAKQEILISGSYCGGKIFDEMLDLIEQRLESEKKLNCRILSSTRFITNKNGCNNWKKLEALTKKYKNRFRIVLTCEANFCHPTENFTMKRMANHAKLMVVDGDKVVTGGSGIEDRWAKFTGVTTPTEEEEKDVPFLSIRSFIAKAFRDFDICVVDGRKNNIAERARQEFYNLMSRWDHYNHTRINIHEKVKKFDKLLNYDPKKFDKKKLRNFYKKLDPHLPIGTCVALQKKILDCNHTREQVKAKMFVTGPEHLKSNFAKELVSLFNRAKNRIVINHMYFHPSNEVLHALKMALKRGVKIEIISNGLDNESAKSHKVFVPRSRYNIRKLLDFGVNDKVQVWEWNVGNTTDHKKLIIVDDGILVTGSSNLGYKSLESCSDFESDVVVYSKNAVARALKSFEVDKTCCKRISKEDAGGKPGVHEIFMAATHRFAAYQIG